MQGAGQLAQGRKGTGGQTRQVGVRCPLDIYEWLSSGRGPRETDTDRVLSSLEQVRDMEAVAGPRMQELRAHALLESKTMGQLLGQLVVEALDARRKKR